MFFIVLSPCDKLLLFPVLYSVSKIKKEGVFIMTCKKCSYILYGSENYCPHCGEQCKEPEPSSNQPTEAEPKPIFISRNQPFEDVASKSRIFQPETAFEESCGVSEGKLRKKEKGSSRGLTAFLSALCILLFGTALFMAADYFGFTSVSEILSPQEQTTEGLTDELQQEFASTFGTISPQINYSPVNCTVSSAESISLRKGPSDSYGQIETISSGSEVQVIGGSAEDSNWVYVYVLKKDLYGWLSASYISGEKTKEKK